MEEYPDKMTYWRKMWMYFLARFRLSSYAVCTMSKGKGYVDYHDYDDCICGLPEHFMTHTCKRCKKVFTI